MPILQNLLTRLALYPPLLPFWPRLQPVQPVQPSRRAGMRWVGLVLLMHAAPAAAADERPGLAPCRLPGVEHGAFCGQLKRPLDPEQPAGRQIDIHFAVLRALARNRKPDPVFLLAGGPGQSAQELAPTAARLLARLSNRRDIVLVDQRGTGRSAPLSCDELPPTTALARATDPQQQLQLRRQCLAQLQALPHGDLRHYSTWVASQDLDAVRGFLGAEQINLVGASYGTRAGLDYMRQFPTRVRRAVLDGVAPPDMVLPASFSQDNEAALTALLQACVQEPACAQQYPGLLADWQALWSSLPLMAQVAHPLTGVVETLRITPELLLGLLRAPLYVPALAAALPAALQAARRGQWSPLVGLASALGGGGRGRGQLYEGMHLSVVCSEDLPRLVPGGALGKDTPGLHFGEIFAQHYRQVCSFWPRGPVPAAFYDIPPAPAATLLLSGGADPATPPRHGSRVARALGAKARHVVVAQAGHGVMALPCMRDVLWRFIDAESDAAALQLDASCAAELPRPPAFVPLVTTSAAAASAAAVSAANPKPVRERP